MTPTETRIDWLI